MRGVFGVSLLSCLLVIPNAKGRRPVRSETMEQSLADFGCQGVLRLVDFWLEPAFDRA